jgi:hypothetical protein
MKEGVAGLPPESVEALRAEVKRIELDSERLQQDMLCRTAGPASRRSAGGPAARGRAEENIKAYLRLIGAAQSLRAAQDCRVIVDSSLPD